MACRTDGTPISCYQCGRDMTKDTAFTTFNFLRADECLGCNDRRDKLEYDSEVLVKHITSRKF